MVPPCKRNTFFHVAIGKFAADDLGVAIAVGQFIELIVDDGQKMREILPGKAFDFLKRFFGSPLDFRIAENGGGFDVRYRLYLLFFVKIKFGQT